MKEIDNKLIFFEDLCVSSDENENGHLIKSLSLKQLSRGRFEIVGNECRVKIFLCDSIRTVVFTNKIGTSKFIIELYSAYLNEPSLDYLRKK